MAQVGVLDFDTLYWVILVDFELWQGMSLVDKEKTIKEKRRELYERYEA